MTDVELEVHPDVVLDPERLREAAAAALRWAVPTVGEVRVLRRAIDARRGRVRLKLKVAVTRVGEPRVADLVPGPVPLRPMNGVPEVAIVGAGPAGLFCAWALAQRGIRAVVLERGKPVRARRHDLAALVRHGALDPESNYCFGEGGAGTFSDGKLYTRSSKRGPVDDVLRAFVAYGAPPEILVDARPHIGTNRLPEVIGSMRAHLADAGVEVRFSSRVDAIVQRGGMPVGVDLSDGTRIDARAVVVAVGHSARDVHGWLALAGARLSAKSFAVGVRIEHPQGFIDRTQFGGLAGHPALGAAAYRLVERAGESSVFSFCMCPGGFVCPAATEPGLQVVNGWSPSSRRGRYANSGWVTEVGPAQIAAAGLSPDDVLAGVEVQRRLEARAYAAGGGDYVAPAQRLDELVAGRSGGTLPECSYPRGLVSTSLDEVLGAFMGPLRAALRDVDRRMRGFASAEAVAVGVETRTSSPVRADRDPETLEAVGCAGVYPCGEGAGYAGGIVSAALDGIRVAEAIARRRPAGRDRG
jgi:uncharacterized protein